MCEIFPSSPPPPKRDMGAVANIGYEEGRVSHVEF